MTFRVPIAQTIGDSILGLDSLSDGFSLFPKAPLRGEGVKIGLGRAPHGIRGHIT